MIILINMYIFTGLVIEKDCQICYTDRTAINMKKIGSVQIVKEIFNWRSV